MPSAVQAGIYSWTHKYKLKNNILYILMVPFVNLQVCLSLLFFPVQEMSVIYGITLHKNWKEEGKEQNVSQ